MREECTFVSIELRGVRSIVGASVSLFRCICFSFLRYYAPTKRDFRVRVLLSLLLCHVWLHRRQLHRHNGRILARVCILASSRDQNDAPVRRLNAALRAALPLVDAV